MLEQISAMLFTFLCTIHQTDDGNVTCVYNELLKLSHKTTSILLLRMTCKISCKESSNCVTSISPARSYSQLLSITNSFRLSACSHAIVLLICSSRWAQVLGSVFRVMYYFIAEIPASDLLCPVRIMGPHFRRCSWRNYASSALLHRQGRELPAMAPRDSQCDVASQHVS